MEAAINVFIREFILRGVLVYVGLFTLFGRMAVSMLRLVR